jgi:GNAT superfamily N-acetyltransferase
MTNVERLEQFWHDLVLTFPETAQIKGAVACHVPGMPVPIFNHAASVSLNGDEVEDFFKTVIKYFSSKKLPFACFRVSPLTRPTSFSSFLEEHGFKKEEEQSIMVFKGKPPEDKPNPDVKIKEISKDEIDTFDKLLVTIFEMPTEWKKVIDRLLPIWIQKGARNYMAYVKRKPVGITTLFSSMKTGGIFNVGTLKKYRRHGIATALTLKALLDSVKKENDLHTLQTVKGGNAERLYQQIGFKTDHTITFFLRKL